MDIPIQSSPKIRRKAVRYVVLQRARRYVWVGLILMAAGILGVVSGGNSLFTLLIFSPVGYVCFFIEDYQGIIRKMEKSIAQGMTIKIVSDGVAYDSPEFATLMKWAGIIKLVKQPQFWLLFARETYLIIPVQSLEKNDQDQIEGKIREHGVQIC